MIINKNLNSDLTKNFYKNNKSIVWMSHQDIVYKIPIGFKKIASTSSSPLTIIENKKKRFLVFSFIPK